MNKQQGFAHIGILFLVVLLAIGGIGYMVYDSSQSKDSSAANKAASNQSTPQESAGLSFEDGIRLQPSSFGVAAGLPVADVSAIQLADGSWRIYAFGQGKGILSAVSKDGINFTADSGARLGDGAGMPRILKLSDGRYRMFFIDAGGIGSAISSDGLAFTKEPGKRISPPSGVPDISGVSTPLKLADGKWHVYFSDLPRPGTGVKPHYVYSATSTDLLTWQLDDGYRIGGDKLSSSAEHPDAILDDKGDILLYYFVNEGKKLMTAKSSDGLTFSDPQETGLDCNDPNIVSLGSAGYRIYCGDFNESVGGIVKSSKFSRLPAIP